MLPYIAMSIRQSVQNVQTEMLFSIFVINTHVPGPEHHSKETLTAELYMFLIFILDGVHRSVYPAVFHSKERETISH
jgi:hypothetical protein